MTIKEFQSSQERRTVADILERERRQYNLRPRHLVLMFGLGFLFALVLIG